MGLRPDLAQRNKDFAKHGMNGTKAHKAWCSMRERCLNPKHKYFYRYGGRGIEICERWKDIDFGFINFLQDMGNPQPKQQLDRIDNNQGYYPDNCRWTDAKSNSRNRSSAKLITYDGQTLCVAEWAEKLNIERKVLQMRLKTKSIEDAFTTPYIPRKGTKI